MTARASSNERFRRGLAGVVAGTVSALGLWFAGLHPSYAAIAGGVVAIAVLWFGLQALRLQARLVAADTEVETLAAQLAAARGNQESLAFDLAQLGNYGN